ncbi:MAG TPA: IucA/IucC family C-terminal-domain containing protein [Bacillus sp. (in: firmicutes)]|uniref:IucA/IucC family C-terminal-domain containing protein n=1 Tax=Bacillus litorisediminis TaxID=2922713 RepID=UPI001FAC20C1|nr:IucA/IucC family C-terminal-domain containing protein [Bacillus litorisediminis]HWO77129.1 IucA/IucC family C-terminal-domain containing protein [Bacillus sp. (in: firmicutes)]
MLDNRLTEEELEELSRFRLIPEPKQVDLRFSAEDIMNEHTIRPILKKIKERIEAPNFLVTASILMKRYAFLPVIYLYAFTKWDKILMIDPKHIYIEDAEKNGIWLPEFRFESIHIKTFPADSRELYRKEAFTELFRNHIYKVITILHQETKVSKIVLWENMSVYLFWMYELLMEEEPDVSEQAYSDYQYIFQQAEGAVFGAYKKNPLTSFNSEKVRIEEYDAMIRIRKTCCYSYMLLKDSESAHCKTCPVKCKLLKSQMKKEAKV